MLWCWDFSKYSFVWIYWWCWWMCNISILSSFRTNLSFPETRQWYKFSISMTILVSYFFFSPPQLVAVLVVVLVLYIEWICWTINWGREGGKSSIKCSLFHFLLFCLVHVLNGRTRQRQAVWMNERYRQRDRHRERICLFVFSSPCS